jgi:hypothetical protein
VAASPVLDDEARFKLALMNIIDQDLRERFRTVEEAADFANINYHRLYRIRARRHDQFSIAWLFKLARSANVAIRINIEGRR